MPRAAVRCARLLGSGGPLRRARTVFLAIAMFNLVLAVSVLLASGVSSGQRLLGAAAAAAKTLKEGVPGDHDSCAKVGSWIPRRRRSRRLSCP